MNDSNEQAQKVGTNSVALQAKGDINYGLSLADMKQLAIDLFEAQILKLQGVAEAVARERAEEIREDILEAIRTKNPKGVEQAADVDFQYALYGVQRDYARTGDEDLGKLLVDLLVDRSKTTERDIMQLVLNQALKTAANLSNSQVRALAVAFLVKSTVQHGLLNLEQFLEYVEQHMLPVAQDLSISAATVQYIAAANCGNVSVGGRDFGDHIAQVYPALFRKGFDDGALPPNASKAFKSMLIPCLHNPELMQVRAATLEILNTLAAGAKLSAEEKAQLEKLFNSNPMSGPEVEQWLTMKFPGLRDFISSWSPSGLSNFQLNSVGQAIAHARIRQHVPEYADLSIWVN